LAEKRGRPTKYDESYNDLTYKYCLLGATDADLARFFDVDEKTINNWKETHPEFLQSLKRGKEEADANVAQRLYARAMGYEHEEDKIFNENGTAMIVPTIKHYPPEPAAAIFWLKNRQPHKWRDKRETELTGADNGPIQVDMSGLSEADLLAKAKEVAAKL